MSADDPDRKPAKLQAALLGECVGTFLMVPFFIGFTVAVLIGVCAGTAIADTAGDSRPRRMAPRRRCYDLGALPGSAPPVPPRSICSARSASSLPT